MPLGLYIYCDSNRSEAEGLPRSGGVNCLPVEEALTPDSEIVGETIRINRDIWFQTI